MPFANSTTQASYASTSWPDKTTATPLSGATPQLDFKSLLADDSSAEPATDEITEPAAAQQQSLANPTTQPLLDTDQGKLEINLASYFDPETAPTYGGTGKLPPLLLPTAANMKALSKDASTKFQAALEAYNIPQAPSQITFDNQGQMQLPTDYAHADQLKVMFQNEPGLERELRTINALTSHLVGSKDSIAFSNEYQMATSKAAVDAVLAKYSYLFNSNRPTAQIALTFPAGGQLELTADGKPVKF